MFDSEKGYFLFQAMVNLSAVVELTNEWPAFCNYLVSISSLPPFFGFHAQSLLQILKLTLLCSVHDRY